MSLLSTAVHIAALLPTVDTPVDLSTEAATIGTVLGGVATAMGGGVLAAGLAIAGVKWGIPQVVGFFKRIAK